MFPIGFVEESEKILTRLSRSTQALQGIQPSSSSFRGSISLLTWWAAGSFAAILGFSRLSYGLLLPALRTDLKGSYGIYGILGTLNFVGYLLGTLALPFVLAYIRRHLFLNVFASCATNIALLLSSVSVTLWQLGLWRFLNGFFAALATVLTIALTLECIPPKARGKASGLIWAGGALGIVLSGLVVPFVLTARHIPGWRLAWIGMGIVGILMALGFFLTRRAMPFPSGAETPRQRSLEEPVARQPFRRTLSLLFHPRRLLLLTLAYTGFGCGYIIYFTFFIALLEQQGVSVLSAGFVWAGIGIAGAVSGWVWGKVVDRWPTGFALALPLLLGAIGSLSVLLQSQIWNIIGATLVGLCAFIAPALIVTALLKHIVTDNDYPASLSVLTAFFAIGQIVGPLVSSWIVERSGLVFGTASSAGVLGFAALCAWGYGVMQRQTQQFPTRPLPGDKQEASV